MTYTDVLGPPLIFLEQAINAQIIRDLMQDPAVFVEFDFGAVLRGDRLSEIGAIRDAIGTALFNPNEGRAILNLPAVANPAMDEYYLPFNNLQPVGSPPVAPALIPPGTPEAPPAPNTARLHVRSRDRDYAKHVELDPTPV
jgi:hypothetical protein